MQQVRAAVRQMPVLPSERYLRYLRLTGRRRELTALAVWLAGRPDIIPTFSEHDPSEPEQTFSSPPENSCEMKTEHANPPSGVFEKGSSASFSSGNDEVPEKRTVLRENAPSPAAAGEGEEARELGRQGDGGVQGSCSDIFPRPSPCLPDENHGEAVASLGRRNGSLEALRDESETAANLRSGCKTTDMDTGGGTISLSTSKQVSADLLPAMKANLVPRDLPVDPETHKVGSQAPANPAQDQLILPTATAGAKAKAKKQPTVKNPPPRLAHVAQKAIARSKISRPLGQAQWQAPGMPGEVPAARDPQRAAKTQHLRHSRVVAGDMVKCQPPESDDNAAAMPVEKGSDISASKAPQGSPVKLSSQSDEEPTTVAAAQLPVDTPPRGPRSNFQKKQPLMQSRLIASRASSSKLFNGPKNGLRRPSAASLPGRRGTTFGVDPTTQPTADPAQLTQEAVDLLSEPQMLAEMATLCVRLSDLFCCRSATSSVDQPSGGQAAMERPSEFEQEPI
ncbi:hypothetical protein, conserved [Eimeria necatrix]|uniref:Uncharacterized protein n=1 Tax=Eimeria necatrix TaxID=51315 RepID=U6MVL4_9EIME|nr:hypothetical protein, conserved [Eimeria necatrix]CDJ68312.1 hypothetical protein, conserved [Eimeria necatrix]